YSISTCLAMTYAGARGNTEQQMARGLHLSPDQAQVHAAFGQLQRQLNEAQNQKGITLNVANALWTQKGHPFQPAFLDLAKGEYQANINQADFPTGAEAARKEINHWVAQQTKDKIQDILPPGSLNSLTRLVLADAIYFKGIWAKPFEKAGTQNQPFHLSARRQVDVPLMHHLDTVKYMENADLQAVELPYSGNKLSMLIVLPRQIEGWAQLEQQLSLAWLSNLLGQMKQQTVDIFLPRFKQESSFELNGPLEKMDLSDAFGSQADFSGIDGTKLLYISAVFHKAWVEVNEEGTEAAAATTTTMRITSAMRQPPPPPVFRADHPFLFLLRDTRSGSLLFLGRLADPGR
ncbi:MAG TPA: serpin family protein, partial [Candidatus Sulfotelmatobacter sp.]|nr:serpin family protein [Candidatus Sulfotelmatobacter sp.]